MAAQPEDKFTQQLFSTEEKQWIRTGLQALIAGIERSQQKYPAGSKMYNAMAGDKAELVKLKEKI